MSQNLLRLRVVFSRIVSILALYLLALTPAATGQVYEKTFDFTEARAADIANTGAVPLAGLVQGSNGNFYGTTRSGGPSGFGTVFKMTPAGVLTTLVRFTGIGGANKGAYPYAGLLHGSDGSFYGTTEQGGAQGGAGDEAGYGTVFKVTPAGVLTTLVEFTGIGGANNGSRPIAGLVHGMGGDGNFYGTASKGGANNFGTVFKVTPHGALTTLVEFSNNGTSNKGRRPGGLVQGADGHFYGTTSQGGTFGQNPGNLEYGYGTVFKMTSVGTLTTLVEFRGDATSNKGRDPEAALVQGDDGNFYGTTYIGGVNDTGTVFKMTPAGLLTTLVEFASIGASNQGRSPSAGLVQGSDRNFYGTTEYGGPNGLGTIFKMTTDGTPSGTTLQTLVSFTGNEASDKGAYPRAGLIQANDGNFYGTTYAGGANGPIGSGTVFKMTPAGVLTTLVDFTVNGVSNKGVYPFQGVQDTDGSFYGTTVNGGTNGVGTIFKMTPAGLLTTLVEFTGIGGANNGSFPRQCLVKGSDGNFYGTTTHGGVNNHGTVFKMTPAGVLTTLVEFTFNGGTNKGSRPYARLVQDSGGNFYGTTERGGANSIGTVFKITTNGTAEGTMLTTLVEFTGIVGERKGAYPHAALVRDSDGAFYGTATALSTGQRTG